MNSDYLAGFFDGEGSCIIKIRSEKRYRTGFQITPKISITQKNKEILLKIKNWLNMGNMYFHKKDNVWHFEIYKNKDLIKFCSLLVNKSVVKKDVIKRFYKCVKIISKKEHLTIKGVERIKKMWFVPKTGANAP